MKETLEELQKRVVISKHDILSALDDLENGKIDLVRARLKPYRDRADEELRLLMTKQPKSPAEIAVEKIGKLKFPQDLMTSENEIELRNYPVVLVFIEKIIIESFAETLERHDRMANYIYYQFRPIERPHKPSLNDRGLLRDDLKFADWLIEAAKRH